MSPELEIESIFLRRLNYWEGDPDQFYGEIEFALNNNTHRIQLDHQLSIAVLRAIDESVARTSKTLSAVLYQTLNKDAAGAWTPTQLCLNFEDQAKDG